MAIIDWTFNRPTDFGREFDRLRKHLDQAFDRFGLASGFGAAFPALNIHDQDSDLVVAIEAPGLHKDSLTVELRENVLTLSGKRDLPAYGNATVLRMECPHGDFRRTLRIPVKVDADKIQANFQNGILLIRMPKSEEAKPRQITIQV